MWNKIVNPLNGKKVNIFSKLGKKILNNYFHQLGGSSIKCVTYGDCRGPGKKCRKKDIGCEYIHKANTSSKGVDKYGCYKCTESKSTTSESLNIDDLEQQETLEMRLNELKKSNIGPPYDIWQEYVDVDGSMYYYNAKQNKTIYEKPDDYLLDGQEKERELEAEENKINYVPWKPNNSIGQSFKDRAEVFAINLEESEEDNLLRNLKERIEELDELDDDDYNINLKKKINDLKREIKDFRGYYKIEELLEGVPHKMILDKFNIVGYDCYKPTILEKYDYNNAKLIKCEVDEEFNLKDSKNQAIIQRENENTDRRYMDEIKDKLDIQGFQYEDGDLVENIAQSGYRTEGVYIIKTDPSGNLYVDYLNTEMDDYGHVGEGFSLGPKRPFCYWRHAKFTKAYWHSNPLPEPLESKYWNPIEIEDLKEYTETRKKYDGSEYNVTFCHYNLGWGTLRFPGNKEQVMKFLSDQKNSETERLYFEAVGDCSDGGTDLVELSDQFYYIEDGSQYN